MEEENNLSYGDLTACGTITTTTGNDYLITAGSNLLFDSYTSYSTSYNMDFKLPDIFLKVIKKMIPEINNVIVHNSYLNIDSSDHIGILTINLFIVLDESSSDNKNYEEKIRDLFKITFHDIDYVVLNVKQFDFYGNKKISEIFKLFGK
jgi:hypothetical protein